MTKAQKGKEKISKKGNKDSRMNIKFNRKKSLYMKEAKRLIIKYQEELSD